MAQAHGINSPMSLSSPEMDISNAPNASSGVESPAISSTIHSSSSPVSVHARPQEDGPCRANCTYSHNSFEEGRCSTSSRSEPEAQGNMHANGDTDLDQHVTEGSLLHRDQGLSEGLHSIGNANHSGQPDANSSSLDVDVEKGWGSSNTKQMDVDEEGPAECCRVCHLTVDRSPSAGEVIKLGCACKDDLALAHQRCAETWFKIKGDRTCEICGSTAQNILRSSDVDQWNDMEASHLGPIRAERCWQNQPLCNTLVVCVLLVLIASWLFRVTLF